MATHGTVKQMHIRGLTALKARAVELQFDGKTNAEIAEELFADKIKDGPRGRSIYYRKKVGDMLSSDCCLEYYRRIMVNQNGPMYFAKALKVLNKELDSENEWIANKAANDIIRMFQSHIMGEDSRSLNITFEGAPELGAPDTASLPEPEEDEPRVLDVVQAEESMVE